MTLHWFVLIDSHNFSFTLQLSTLQSESATHCAVGVVKQHNCSWSEGSYLSPVKRMLDLWRALQPKWEFLILHAVMKNWTSKRAATETSKTAEHQSRKINKQTELRMWPQANICWILTIMTAAATEYGKWSLFNHVTYAGRLCLTWCSQNRLSSHLSLQGNFKSINTWRPDWLRFLCTITLTFLVRN